MITDLHGYGDMFASAGEYHDSQINILDAPPRVGVPLTPFTRQDVKEVYQLNHDFIAGRLYDNRFFSINPPLEVTFVGQDLDDVVIYGQAVTVVDPEKVNHV